MKSRIQLSPRRRGVASMLAMLFLVLFATLAVGFYASTDVSSQVSSNDEHVSRAFLASESGMDFMKYQLAHVHVSPTTPADQVINSLYTDLQSQLNGTGNLGAFSISKSGNTISIPAGADRIKLDAANNAGFHATITNWAGEIVVKTDGYYGSTASEAARSISMDFSRQQHTTNVFGFAIASKGQIVMKKGAVTSVSGVDPAIAAMMSAKGSAAAITVTGGTIGGDLNIVSGATAAITGGSVGGSSVAATIQASHVHTVDPPEFPTIDPTVYKQYATATWVNNAKTQSNIRIPASSNPKFNANDTVQGIMYVESPNKITFNGNFTLKGFIVMESSASTTDTLAFSGNLTMSPVPSGTQFDAVRATSGIAILAPNAAMSMTGSAGGTVRGNIIVNTFNYAGAADLQIDQGTLMTLDPNANSAVFNSAKSVKFSATGANNQPTSGVSYSTYFSPEPSTYQEVMP